MKRFALFLFACVAFSLGVEAQNNIVSSLQQSNPGQGKVTIHQDARITALLGSTYIPGAGERRVLKSAGYRIQLYAGNNTRQAKNEAQKVSDDIKQAFPRFAYLHLFQPTKMVVQGRRFS